MPVLAITGASSGIGRCTARLFAARGWKVGLIARGEAGLAETCAEVGLAGPAGCYAVADVTDSAALEAAARAIEERLGPIDVWINAAGNGVFGALLDVPEVEYQRVTNVTYLGTVNGCRVALRRMHRHGRGSIVNVCSATVFGGLPLMTSYVGAKAAVRGFGQSLRAELRLQGSPVRVCTVFPPAVNTPFFNHAANHLGQAPRPVAPVYQPEIVAKALYLAATGRAPEVAISSVVVAFSLLSRFLPGVALFLTGRLRPRHMLSDDPAAARAREPSLFAPPTRIFGTHGSFDAQARGWSAHVWLRGLLRGRARLSPARAAPAVPSRRLPSGTAPGPGPAGSAPPDGVSSDTSR